MNLPGRPDSHMYVRRSIWNTDAAFFGRLGVFPLKNSSVVTGVSCYLWGRAFSSAAMVNGMVFASRGWRRSSRCWPLNSNLEIVL